MQGRSRYSISIFSSFFLFLLVSNSSVGEPGELSNKIAFLKNGEVWVSDIDGKKMKQITSDSGKVDDFLFSPSLQYLAYARIIRFEDRLTNDLTRIAFRDRISPGLSVTGTCRLGGGRHFAEDYRECRSLHGADK